MNLSPVCGKSEVNMSVRRPLAFSLALSKSLFFVEVSTSFSSIIVANDGLMDNNTIENKLMKTEPRIPNLACCNLSAMGYADPFMLYD